MGFTPSHAARHHNETNAINRGEGEAAEWGEILCECQPAFAQFRVVLIPIRSDGGLVLLAPQLRRFFQRLGDGER